MFYPSVSPPSLTIGPFYFILCSVPHVNTIKGLEPTKIPVCSSCCCLFTWVSRVSPIRIHSCLLSNQGEIPLEHHNSHESGHSPIVWIDEVLRRSRVQSQGKTPDNNWCSRELWISFFRFIFDIGLYYTVFHSKHSLSASVQMPMKTDGRKQHSSYFGTSRDLESGPTFRTSNTRVPAKQIKQFQLGTLPITTLLRLHCPLTLFSARGPTSQPHAYLATVYYACVNDK
jgi:hypothetical protein